MAEFLAAGETPEILFWVGCAGSFDQRAQRITKAFATILNKVEISFAIITLYWGRKKCAPAILHEEPAMNFFFK
jgi:Fe-S oxidoreductase